MAKKGFKDDNPALNFIVAADDLNGEYVPTHVHADADTATHVYQYKRPERRSRRLQALVTPRAYTEAAKLAEKRGVSVNEIVNMALEDYVRRG